MQLRIGEGWDTHALVPGRPLVLGGVSIPYERGLLGHSDADALLHAITDAVLGALLGVVLGVCFGVAMMYAVRDQGLEVISLPWGQLGVFLAASVVVGVLAAVFPARRAGRLDILRAIATE